MGQTDPDFEDGSNQPQKMPPPDIQFNCPHCQALLAIASHRAGETVPCPHCQGKFQVPVPQAYANPMLGSNPGSQYPGSQYPPEVQAFISKKVAAGICGILLGAFGVHKFILGFNTAGAIMLSIYFVCLISGFCLVIPIIGCIAISVIGVIEGIMYLTKSDEEFYQAYAIEKREWF